jgi:hypothetical protein
MLAKPWDYIVLLPKQHITEYFFFSFGTTAPIWALAYLHETLRFTSVLQILDSQSLGGWSACCKASACT